MMKCLSPEVAIKAQEVTDHIVWSLQSSNNNSKEHLLDIFDLIY